MAFRKLYSTKNVILCSLNGPKRSVSVTSSRLEEARSQVASKIEIKPEWDRALSEAEKCIGKQVSFLSLRYLMNDEVTNWGEHMQRLEGSNHPMYNAAR